MAATYDDVRKAIRTLSNAQIHELYDLLSDRCSQLDQEARFKFRVGDKVKFDAGRRGIIVGHITEFKRNGKVGVAPTHGLANWRVSGRLLIAAADPAKPPVEKLPGLPPKDAANNDEF